MASKSLGPNIEAISEMFTTVCCGVVELQYQSPGYLDVLSLMGQLRRLHYGHRAAKDHESRNRPD